MLLDLTFFLFYFFVNFLCFMLPFRLKSAVVVVEGGGDVMPLCYRLYCSINEWIHYFFFLLLYVFGCGFPIQKRVSKSAVISALANDARDDNECECTRKIARPKFTLTLVFFFNIYFAFAAGTATAAANFYYTRVVFYFPVRIREEKLPF